MASEYLLKKYKDVKPDEVRELTKEEKRRNWWYYNKWYVVAGVLAVVFVLCITFTALSKPTPDYSIAYIGTHPLSEQTAEAIRSGLTSLSPDMNGDKKVIVELQQYVSMEETSPDALYYAEAAVIKMIGDLSSCQSYFFLLEDPQDFQGKTCVLLNLDGTLPADDDTNAEGKYLLWADCPVLAGLEIPEAEGLAFARRGFWGHDTTKHPEACAALWDALTAK